MSQARDAAERFWSKVNKDGPVIRPELGPCWIFTGSKTKDGYGQFRLPDGGDGTTVYAHRFVWELLNGPMHVGHKACHRCDNPPCVRPEHLFPGTQAANMTDMARKGRRVVPQQRGEQHWAARLTGSQALEIRRRTAAGESHRAIARAFGVSRPTVTAIHARRLWAHLDETGAMGGK